MENAYIVYFVILVVYIARKLIQFFKKFHSNPLTPISYIFDAYVPRSNEERETMWLSKSGRSKNMEYHENRNNNLNPKLGETNK